MKLVLFLAAVLVSIAPSFAETVTPNWAGKYAPCNRHDELRSPGHMNLGIRISTSNPALAKEFERALDFWTKVLDLEWHNEDTEECSVQLVDGTPALFDWCACTSARSHMPDRPAFQGWVAFNPRMKLSRQEMFLDSVHEIGHLLGLTHSSSETSIMFYFGLEKEEWLESSDLDALSIRHALRPGAFRDPRTARILVSAPDHATHKGLNPATWFVAAH